MKTPQQQIETKIEGVAFMLSAIYGGSMLQQKDSARQILFNSNLAMINPDNDWAVNPYEAKWRKSFGESIDHYRDLMDGYDRCREQIIILKEME